MPWSAARSLPSGEKAMASWGRLCSRSTRSVPLGQVPYAEDELVARGGSHHRRGDDLAARRQGGSVRPAGAQRDAAQFLARRQFTDEQRLPVSIPSEGGLAVGRKVD